MKTPAASPAETARILLEALPYLQRFRGATVVVKYGGSAMEDPALVDSTLRDIVLLEIVSANPVVVHGGGKAITRRMNAAGLKAVFAGGYRVTDAESVRIVQETLDGEVNPGIVRRLKDLGGRAAGVSGTSVFHAAKAPPMRLADGSTADLGQVGNVCAVDTPVLQKWIDQTVIPVVSPVARATDGGTLNVNADEAAMEAAIALRAAKLIYLSDVPGVLRDPKDESTLIPSIHAGDVPRLKAEGTLSGGMLPKVDGAVAALERGVGKVQFIDGRVPHALLLELFTDAGIGTEIVL